MKKTVSRREFLSQCGQCAFFLAGVKAFEWVSPRSESWAQSGLRKGFLGKKVSPYFTALDGVNPVRALPSPVSGGKREARVLQGA